MNFEFWANIRHMLRILKTCQTFDEFVNGRDLTSYQNYLHEALRRGIKDAEHARYCTFFRQRNNTQDRDTDLEDEIADLKKKDFFDEGDFAVPNLHNRERLLVLGWKGRALLRGNFIKRWAYFIQFALEEHSHIYSALLGGVLLTFILSLITGFFGVVWLGIIWLWSIITTKGFHIF